QKAPGGPTDRVDGRTSGRTSFEKSEPDTSAMALRRRAIAFARRRGTRGQLDSNRVRACGHHRAIGSPGSAWRWMSQQDLEARMVNVATRRSRNGRDKKENMISKISATSDMLGQDGN